MQKIIRCAVYTRVSTDNQAEKKYNSCVTQRELVEHFIKSQNNFKIYDYFNDEGFSGKDLKRPAMQAILRAVRQREIDLILSYKIDRLTRSLRDFYYLMGFFEQCNADFISITERFDTSTPSGRLLRNVLLTFAQFERELARERTMDKLLQRAQKGMWNGGFVPLGYRNDHKKLVVHKAEARVVDMIFKKYISLGSLSDLQQYLKNKNILDKNGNFFSQSTLRYILRNLLYTGKIKYQGNIYEGEHVPIINETLFNLVQNNHKKTPRRLRNYKEFLFSGIVHCEECGSRMTPYYVTKKPKRVSKRYYYYRCTSTFKKGWNACRTRQINAKTLEIFVFENLKRIASDKFYIDNLIERYNKKYENACPELKNNNMTGRPGLVPGRYCPGIDPVLYREKLKILLTKAEQSPTLLKARLLHTCINKIIYSRNMVRIYLHSDIEEYDKKQTEDNIPNKLITSKLEKEKKASIFSFTENTCILVEIPAYILKR